MPQQDTILFSEIKLEISEVSEFSILTPIKLGKVGNCFKTCSCFAVGSSKFPRFPSFWFWPLNKNRKLGKLGNCFKTCSCFAGGSWKFPRFPSFRFWPLYKNRKFRKLVNCLKTCKVNWFFLFVWGSWKFPRLPSFPPDNKNLENSDSFSKLLNLIELLFSTWGNWIVQIFRFWPLCWNRKLGKLFKIFSRLVKWSEFVV